jgi:hypothetical protein
MTPAAIRFIEQMFGARRCPFNHTPVCHEDSHTTPGGQRLFVIPNVRSLFQIWLLFQTHSSNPNDIVGSNTIELTID